jgi:tRNA U55 pseudouridine synthase TruB
MDAVIHYVTTIPAIRSLLCVAQHDYLPNQFEAVQIDSDIYFQLKELKHAAGQVEIIKFQIFSYEHPVQYLQVFIDKCNGDYERRIANKLGTSLYYFDMITQSKSRKSNLLFGCI